VTARYKTEKGFLGARKSTAAIIVLTRRCRGLEETAVAVMRIADDENNLDSLFVMIETRDPAWNKCLVSLRVAKGQTT